MGVYDSSVQAVRRPSKTSGKLGASIGVRGGRRKYQYSWYPLDRHCKVGRSWGSRVPKYLKSSASRRKGREATTRGGGGAQWNTERKGRRRITGSLAVADREDGHQHPRKYSASPKRQIIDATMVK